MLRRAHPQGARHGRITYSPRSNEEVVASYQRNLALVLSCVMGSLSAEALHTLRTPISIGQVVDPVPVNLLLHGCCGPGDSLARSRLLLRSMDLAFAVGRGGTKTRGRIVLRWQHLVLAH